MSFKVAVVGEVCVDYRVSLPYPVATLLAGPAHYADYATALGGTAANFASVVSPEHLDASIIAKIGDDYHADYIRRALDRIPGTHHLLVADSSPTKIVFSIRGTASPISAYSRIMIASTHAAPSHFSPSDVQELQPVLSTADVILTDCYSLLAPTSSAALSELVVVAEAADVPLATDLVPHDLLSFVPAETIDAVVTSSSLVVTELRTVMMLLGADPRDIRPVLAVEDAREVQSLLTERYGAKHWLLRFGLDQAEEELVIYRDGRSRHQVTDYRSKPHLQGDRQTASGLIEFLASKSGTAAAKLE